MFYAAGTIEVCIILYYMFRYVCMSSILLQNKSHAVYFWMFPTVGGVQVPEGSRGIAEMHPIGTLGSDRTEAAHPYITTHPEMRDSKRGSQG